MIMQFILGLSRFYDSCKVSIKPWWI